MTIHIIDLTKKELHLKRWLGCGTTLISKPYDGFFRREGKESDLLGVFNNYSEVMYHFFTLFFLPIWPVGCYRVATIYRQEQSFEVEEYKKVTKNEEWDKKEIIKIYLFYWLIFATIVLFIIVCSKPGEDY